MSIRKEYLTLAKTCYIAMTAYLESMGDFSKPRWEAIPDDVKQRMIKEEVLIHYPKNRTAESAHEEWVEFKKEKGWTYGPYENEEFRTHPHMVSFNELPSEEKTKLHIFNSLVRLYKETDIMGTTVSRTIGVSEDEGSEPKFITEMEVSHNERYGLDKKKFYEYVTRGDMRYAGMALGNIEDSVYESIAKVLNFENEKNLTGSDIPNMKVKVNIVIE